MIPIFSNSLGKEELAAVERVFASRWLGRGKECAAFEKEFGAHIGQERVLLFNNCTAAAFVALEALGIGEGDEVILPTIQFVGVANAVMRSGARPVFADVDPHTLNILPEEIERLRTDKTVAVFLLHYGGHSAPMEEIYQAAEQLLIIEDAANAVSSTWRGQACGTLGDAGMWSFDAMKELVMSDGGALWMDREATFAKADELRYLGFPAKQTSGTDSQQAGNSRWWEFQIEQPSGRYISNDVLAAIGRVQLRKLPRFIQKRYRIWTQYQLCLGAFEGIQTPPEPALGCITSYYLYWIQLGKRDELAQFLTERQIYCTFRYFPLHLVRAYGHEGDSLPNAEWANEHTLCIPLHQNLEPMQVGRIIDTIESFVKMRM